MLIVKVITLNPIKIHTQIIIIYLILELKFSIIIGQFIMVIHTIHITIPPLTIFIHDIIMDMDTIVTHIILYIIVIIIIIHIITTIIDQIITLIIKILI